MDAASRAELDALRIRAYGPSPDIAGDAESLARLVELEELAMPKAGPPDAAADADAAPAASAADRGGTGAADGAATAVVLEPSAHEEVSPRPRAQGRRARERWHVATVAVLAVVAIVLGGIGGIRASDRAESAAAAEAAAAANSMLSEPGGRIFVPVQIDAVTGTFVDVPAGTDVPRFPIGGDMAWAQPLGDYYGWKLWIGAAPTSRGTEHCILLAADADTLGRCIPREWRADGVLLVSLPADRIAEEDRPDGMTADQSVAFVWGQGGYLTILLTPGRIG